MEEEVKKALDVLRAGGLILYPTDTVWGIGCDATNSMAVQKIYDLKHSVNKKGMIVLLDKVDNVARYFSKTPSVAWDLLELADKPLTLILPNASGVAENLIPEEGTLAVRVPDHDFCRRLISRMGRPLVSTSANISGEETPLCFSDITDEIKSGVDYVVSPAMEGRPTRQPSSIMMLGEGCEIKIIR